MESNTGIYFIIIIVILLISEFREDISKIIRRLKNKNMNVNFFFLIKISYYYFIYRLTRSMSNHIGGKDAKELVEYWEALYENKLRRILGDKSKDLFGE